LVMVEQLADNLLEGKYYMPFGPGGFRQHVLENGLLVPRVGSDFTV
jgi:hypothetical protein